MYLLPTHSMNNTIENALAKQEADIMFDAVWKRSGHHRLELDWDIARAFIERIAAYNDFDAKNVLHALDLVDQIIPRMHYDALVDGQVNPNNGRRAFRISVGREGSPVIYIDLYELHRFDSPKYPMTPEMVEKIKTIMTSVGVADESDCTVEDLTAHNMGKSYEFRFWWD